MSAPASKLEPYLLTEDGNEFVIRIPKDRMSREEVARLVDLLALENLGRKLAVSDEEVEKLAREAKKSAWERVRPMFEEKMRGR